MSRRIRCAVALASSCVVFGANGASAQPYDHLKCYKIRDTQTFQTAYADIETIEAAFGLQNCRIKKKAKLFCIPASKDVTAITDGVDDPFEADDLTFDQTCYKVTCPQETIAAQTISDQFGTRTADRFKASMLCVPSVIGPPPTTSTTTSTTTTSTSTTLPAPATWSLRAGNASAQTGVAIGVDGDGNVVATGTFAGEIDFGLGALTSAGLNDIFVVKLDPSGVPLWNVRFGDANDQAAFDLGIDSGDNIVVVGGMNGTVDFGGGPLMSAGGTDAYLVQLAPDGSHSWSASFGGATNDNAYSVKVDAADDVVVAGSFQSASIDFGGGPIAILGAMDCFFAKFSSSGTYVLADAQGGGSAACFLSSVDVDPMGSIVMAASISGSVDFGGGALMSAGSFDVAAAKYDYLGSHAWSKRFGDASLQLAASVSIDNTGYYFAGNVQGSIDFGGGPLTSAGGNDVFLTRLDALGTHVWSQIYGDASGQSTAEVFADGLGNVHTSGLFAGDINFGGPTLMSAGGNDGFVAKHSSAGAHTSSFGFGDVGDQNAGRMVVDGAGNRYVTGTFVGTIDLGDGPLVAVGSSDVFIAKLTP